MNQKSKEFKRSRKMEVLEALRTRRSIRKYTKEEIPEGDIRKIIEAAMSGPSAVNSQPWHFIIVKSRSILNEIPKASPYAQMTKDAAIAIVVYSFSSSLSWLWGGMDRILSNGGSC